MKKIIVFDIRGPAAHFRKYFTNSSSLSYAFPPRTVITGMIGAILGLERDSYYELLSPDTAQVALKINCQVRKIMQTIKFINTKQLNWVNGYGGPTMIPTEIVVPQEGKELVYRVYFSHKDERIQKNLLEKLEHGPIFPLFLGRSEFLANPVLVGEFTAEPSQGAEVQTVVNMSLIEGQSLVFQPDAGKNLIYLKEQMPYAFGPGRKLIEICNMLYERSCQGITARFKTSPYYIDELDETLLFMEEGV
ncbi:CRISPR-associated protein Cas5 [Thermincola ferriacetica]|uniref:CRISPR-associated protein Cas5 n=1 Tax=Thermincola ferriacetica TaxID=281456 RepID=A0A0L6W1R3_9FIRM|nr:CRISPR-associated protein Cas5 [Thermincola ferriacetica]KNZ69512.1 CRISPR-associated protein Cas5 [Thermincola ferriacetica]